MQKKCKEPFHSAGRKSLSLENNTNNKKTKQYNNHQDINIDKGKTKQNKINLIGH